MIELELMHWCYQCVSRATKDCIPCRINWQGRDARTEKYKKPLEFIMSLRDKGATL